MDQYCSHDKQLVHFTVAWSQVFSIRDLCDNLVKKLLLLLAPKSPNSSPAGKTSKKKATKKKRDTTAKHKLGETPAPWLPVSMQLTPKVEHITAEIEKM